MAETIGLLILELGATALGYEAGVGAALGATSIFGSVTVASTVGAGVLLAGSIALSYALAPGAPKPADGTQTLKQPIPPRPFGYGRARLAGAYMLYEMVPGANDFSHDVIAIHQGRIGGYVLFYLNEDLVRLGRVAGACVDVLMPAGKDGRYSISGYIDGTNNLLNMDMRHGLATETAYSGAVSALPEFWTSAHRGDGIASVYMLCRSSTAIEDFPNQWPHALPRLSVVADLSPIWDPRDGSQSRTDPSTWGRIAVTGAAGNGAGKVRLTLASTAALTDNERCHFSGIGGTTEANDDRSGGHVVTIVDATHVDLLDVTFVNAYTSGGALIYVSRNPVLQLVDYLTSGAGFGEVRGPGLDYDEVIAPVLAAWMAEADICDELVVRRDGLTEKRYESSGWAFHTTDPADVLQAMLATCDGWLTEAGDGTLALRVGKYAAPTVTFTDDHLIAVNIQYGVADEDVVNELRTSYVAPGNHYREAPGIPWRDTVSIAEIGRVRSSTLPLTWVQSHSQARRLAKRSMARNVAALRGSLSTTLYGLQAIGQRFVGIRSRQVADLTNAVIEIVAARIDLANARVTFDWVLVNPNAIDAFDPATEEGEAPNYFPVPGTAGTSPSFTVSDAGFGGTLRVQFSDPKQNQLSYALEYRVGSSGPWTRRVVAPGQYSVGGGLVTIDTFVAPGTYNVRVAGVGAQGIAALGNWSSLAGTSVVIA